MTFAHLSFLVGLGAAAVPVLLHFLRSRRVRRAFFSSLALLRRVHQERSSRMKLTQLLLLLIRIGIIAALTLSFAQPIFTNPRLAALNPGPRLVAVVWDNPLAMGARERAGGGPTAADLGRGRLERVLARMDPSDTVIVVATSPAARTVFQGRRQDLQLTQLPPPSSGASDMVRALHQATTALHDRPAADRLCIIVSDFRRRTFPASTGADLPPARTLLVPARSTTVPNWGVTGLTIEPPTAVVGDEVTISATAWPSSAAASQPTTATLTIDGRIVGTRALPATRSSVKTQFKWQARGTGAHRVSVTLAPDGLDGDNERTSIVTVLGQRKVLIVNGHKRATPTQDDGFYLRRVFGTERKPQPGIVAREIFQLGTDERLTDLDLVVLVNVPDVPPGALARLGRYVRQGGTVLVFLGDQVQPGTYNAGILKLAPSLTIDRHASGGGAWHVPEPSPGPLEMLFEDSYWRGVHSESYFLIHRAPGGVGSGGDEGASGVRLPVQLEDGTPAVAIAGRGRGSVILINTGGTTAASDLPLHPIFPVVAMEAARLATARPVPSFPVGSTVPLALDPDDPTPSQAIQAPDGHLYTERPVRAGDSVVVRFTHTERPGIYEVQRHGGGGPAGSSDFFAITVPESESDLALLSPGELSRRLPGATIVNGTEKGEGPGARPVMMPTILDLLLGCLAVLLLVEVILVWSLEEAMRPGSTA